VSAPDVMERAAACMDAAVSAALEDAQAHGFPAQLMPSGVPRKTCGLLDHLPVNPLCCAIVLRGAQGSSAKGLPGPADPKPSPTTASPASSPAADRPPRMWGVGRCDNLALLSHSSATLFAAPLAARRAGALALLGSYLFPSAQAFASLGEWSRRARARCHCLHQPSVAPWLPASRTASRCQAGASVQALSMRWRAAVVRACPVHVCRPIRGPTSVTRAAGALARLLSACSPPCVSLRPARPAHVCSRQRLSSGTLCKVPCQS
jgi:hypothetical protein